MTPRKRSLGAPGRVVMVVDAGNRPLAKAAWGPTMIAATHASKNDGATRTDTRALCRHARAIAILKRGLLGAARAPCYNSGVKIATWNVNSLRMRAARVTAWLATHTPDVLCLQETKVEDGKFPRALLEDAGYHVEFHGQKSYNGVAIASKLPITEVQRGFGDGGDDAQARCLGGTIAGWRVYSLYVPNGQEVGSDKYQYKLGWLARLATLAAAQAQAFPRVALCGDFNIAPADNDVHDPAAWREQVLCSTAERARLAEVMACGYSDGFRALYPEARAFSWWDYRGASFFRDKGLRIDHVLCSAGAQALLAAVEIDRDERKGEGASDHAPVMATFRDA